MNAKSDEAGYSLDSAAMARSFSVASNGYDAAANLQSRVREELLSRLSGLQISPRDIVDLGAGTGAATVLLKRRFRRARVVAADVAPGMLQVAGQRSRFWRPIHCLHADARSLPMADASVDLVYSNLMLQWVDPLDMALSEIARVLRPGGLLLASSFGPETLNELRGAWAEADDAVHVNRFVDMHDFGSALQRAGFAEPVLDVDRHVLHYAQVADLMRQLKAIGAHNVNAGRARGLTGRGQLTKMMAAYERARTERGLPATYQVVYAVAWAPAKASQGQRLPVAKETHVTLDAMRARLSRKGPPTKQ
jgi:malonyl-CoA O-methyltransferase